MVSLPENPVHRPPAGRVGASRARLLGTFLVAFCVQGHDLWQPAMAASVVPSGVIDTRGSSTFGYEFPGNGETNFSLRLNDDAAVRVDLEPSPSASDEFFNLRLSTKGVPAFHDLTIRWEKHGGLDTASAPSERQWSHFNWIVFTDRGFVESASVRTAENAYEVFLTFTSPYVNMVQFDFLWPGFNDSRSEFSMLFDANGVDPVSHMPIPGGIWLLGSGIIALAGLRRPWPRRSCRRNRSTGHFFLQPVSFEKRESVQ